MEVFYRILISDFPEINSIYFTLNFLFQFQYLRVLALCYLFLKFYVIGQVLALRRPFLHKVLDYEDEFFALLMLVLETHSLRTTGFFLSLLLLFFFFGKFFSLRILSNLVRELKFLLFTV